MWYAYALLVALNFADYKATDMLIQNEGFGQEVNPFLYNMCVSVQDTWPIFLAKCIPLLVLGIILYKWRNLPRKRKVMTFAISLLIGDLLPIVAAGLLMVHQIHL